ncbi:DedA family protein [Streptomyces ficellus]|uniref:DedA family protein n=1 Tax=Streptomyces ficellus TaxID=1977088 RepID=A0ABT7ZAL1_9ACTN|nr:DedA family protein [Streptomyces ficellus]MDN3296540.1 DedA family protein [Streptomyces ficellus]
MHVQEWLETVPAVSIYLLVGVVIGLESLGIPLPGEIVLVSSALLASQHGDIDPYVLGACATAGAIIGDSIGYAIGRRGGRPLLTWLGGKFPKHFSEANIAMAERSFEKWGMWAVFFGRFVALLRIFAGPLAGVLRMPYWKFLIANVFGGILWAGGTTAVIYSVGVVAEAWLKRFSWLGLVLAVLVGLTSMLVLKSRAKKAAARSEARSATATTPAAPAPAPAEPVAAAAE